jgi:hypothetical protein
MESLDLNIDNYDYEDILNLFKLKIDFNVNDLKKAKNTVLMMHPDKSKLDKQYFLFFGKAYKILHSVFQFREKANNSENYELPKEEIEYLADKDEYNEAIIKNLRENNKLNNDEFNEWFNDLFNKVKLENEYEDSGYGNWLKNNDDLEIKNCNNLTEMNQQIEKRKQILRDNQIINFKDLNEFNNNCYCDLTNSKPEDYSADLFSKFQFEDLKRAHEESVVPVTEKDFKPQYTSFEDIQQKRQIAHLDPIKDNEANKILANKTNNENVINSHRAYKLVKQQEDMDKANQKWWSSLKQLK